MLSIRTPHGLGYSFHKRNLQSPRQTSNFLADTNAQMRGLWDGIKEPLLIELYLVPASVISVVHVFSNLFLTRTLLTSMNNQLNRKLRLRSVKTLARGHTICASRGCDRKIMPLSPGPSLVPLYFLPFAMQSNSIFCFLQNCYLCDSDPDIPVIKSTLRLIFSWLIVSFIFRLACPFSPPGSFAFAWPLSQVKILRR